MTVGIYALYTGDTPMAHRQQSVLQAVSAHDGVQQSHAFFYYEDRNPITIDIVPDEYMKNDRAFVETMNHYMHEPFPANNFSIVVDHNYS